MYRRPTLPLRLRLCAVLDDLRAKSPRPITLPTLAARHGVSERQIRRDVATLATRYPVRVGQGVGNQNRAVNGAVWIEET